MNTLGEFLALAAQRYGSRQALVYREGSAVSAWTYSELGTMAGRAAGGLYMQGLRKGDRVVISAPNSPAWVAAYFGALELGAIVVPLDTRSAPDFVARAVGQTEPKLALLAESTRANWNCTTPTLLVDQVATLPGAPGSAPKPDLGAADVAELIYTSGTTGDPKGVMLTHGNILANMQGLNPLVPRIPEFRMISVLPLSHMFEQTVGLLLALRRAACIYYPTDRQPATLAEAFRLHHPTTMVLVPQLLHLLLAGVEREVEQRGQGQNWRRMLALAEHMPDPARRLLFRQVHERFGGALRFLISGGAPLEPELIHKWALLGIPIMQGYGTTETCSGLTATALGERNATSVGRAIPNVRLKLAADGEILVKGPTVMPGYWHAEEQTRRAFADGWYKTGDLGSFDEAGNLYLNGRKNDLIVLANGEKVYPDDVEQALKRQEGVADAAVIGLPGPRGPVVHAALICDPPIADPTRLVRRANADLAVHQRIRSASIWTGGDFPRTLLLKVKKYEVLKAVQAERKARQSAPRQSGPLRPAEELVIRHIARLTGVAPDQLGAQTAMYEVPELDSLAQLELLTSLETETGAQIDEAQFTLDTTIAQLADLLAQQQSPTAAVAGGNK